MLISNASRRFEFDVDNARLRELTVDEYLDVGGAEPCVFRTYGEEQRVAWIAQKLFEIPPGSTILDAGAGAKRYEPFCFHLRYISQDFGLYNPEEDPAGMHQPAPVGTEVDIQSDICCIPLPDASVDAVLCVSVIEHIPRPLEAIKELRRLLRPGGQLIMTAPFVTMTHYAPYHFYSGFTRYFYEEAAREAGLRIIELAPGGNYFAFLQTFVSRLPGFAQRYAPEAETADLEAATTPLLALLERCAKADTGSSELLNFGWQLLAERPEDQAPSRQ